MVMHDDDDDVYVDVDDDDGDDDNDEVNVSNGRHGDKALQGDTVCLLLCLILACCFISPLPRHLDHLTTRPPCHHLPRHP